MSNRSTLLLEHHLKELRLPTFLREYRKLAAQCAAENVDHPDYLLRLSELELIDRHQRMVQRRIRAARFPAVKSLDTFDFLAIPSVNKQLVMELARCEYIEHRENVIAVGNSGTGKTHVALGLGLAACQKGMSVGFTTAAALVHELMEARDDRRLLNLQRQLARLRLLIIDELGFVPLSTTGAELLFEVFSQRYERGSVLVTTNLPFDEWTDVFGSERLTGALFDRLTHHVHILEMNGDSYRLKHSRQSAASQVSDTIPPPQWYTFSPPLTGRYILNLFTLKQVGIRLLPDEKLEIAVELEGGLTEELEQSRSTLILTNRRLIRYSTAGHKTNVVSAAIEDADSIEINMRERNRQWVWVSSMFIVGGFLLGLLSLIFLSSPLSPMLMALSLILIGVVFFLTYAGGLTGQVIIRAGMKDIKCRMIPKALDDMGIFVQRFYELKLGYPTKEEISPDQDQPAEESDSEIQEQEPALTEETSASER